MDITIYFLTFRSFPLTFSVSHAIIFSGDYMINTENTQLVTKSDITITFIHHVFRETLEHAWNQEDVYFFMHKFIYVIKGRYIMTLNGRELILNQDNGLFVPKGTEYAAHSLSENFDYIEVEFLTDKDPYETFSFMDVYHFSNPKKVEALMINMLDCWHGNENGKELILKGKMYELFLILMNENLNCNGSRNYHKIKKSLDFIDKNYFRRYIDVSELADICDISISQYNRIFRSLFNTSPVKYMNELRIEKAKKLLTETQYSVLNIAQMCGFSDSYYFSKIFKEHTCWSPLKYRSSHSQ